MFGATSALPSVDALRTDPALAPLSTVERTQLDARGVEGFIAYLKSRADRADDLVDYGFIKVQTDVYRVRQLVLGTTAATRLAVSPALATIAQAETAVASQQQISTFYQNLVAAPTATSNVGIVRSGAASRPAAFETVTAPIRERSGPPGPATRAGGFPLLAISGPSLSGIGVTSPTLRLDARIETQPDIAGIGGVLEPSDAVRAITDLGLISTGVAGRAQATVPTDVINASPIVGKANIRTTAIAQRIEDPKAIEAKDYTAATRHEAVAALIRLADQLREEDGGVTPGLFNGIDVYGVREDPFLGANNTTRRVPLATFITDRTRLDQLLITPVRSRAVPNANETLPDEGAYFSDSADLSDNTVALMRQLEGRIKLYRDAIARAQQTLGMLREAVARGNVRLGAIEDELAEARHDVSVARSLLAEETERIAGINLRRARVLAEEVRFLAFVRPRETDNLATAPRHQVDPGPDRRAGAGLPRRPCRRARRAHPDAAGRP